MEKLSIIKTAPKFDPEAYVAGMWLMFLRAPAKRTAPGEPVDLGEIGTAAEKNWERLTPYSLSQRRND